MSRRIINSPALFHFSLSVVISDLILFCGNVPFMTHVKHNLKLIIPAISITAVMYAVFGMLFIDNAMDATTLNQISSDLQSVMYCNENCYSYSCIGWIVALK